MAEGAEDRTEAATPARLLRAKDEGHAPVARELAMFAGLVAGAFALLTSMHNAAGQFVTALADLLASAGAPLQGGSPMRCLWTLIMAGLHVVVPVGAASAAAVAGANLLQTGFKLKLSVFKLDVARISPGAGLKRLVGAENAIGAVKSVVKVMAIGGVMVWLIPAQLVQVTSALVADPDQIAELISRAVFGIAAAIFGVQGAIAFADLAWTRMQFSKSMRMSHTEVKDETKDADGNPHVKARLKRMIASRARENLQSAMSRATVVITNPTHYAVALDYQQGQTEAPKIVAKGAGDMAARIRAMANSGHVPIVSSPPLARALFKLELESEIPAEHYKAVAEIIAYVWRLSSRVGQDQHRL